MDMLKQIQRIGNRIYGGLGDLLVTEVSPRGIATLGLGAAIGTTAFGCGESKPHRNKYWYIDKDKEIRLKKEELARRQSIEWAMNIGRDVSKRLQERRAVFEEVLANGVDYGWVRFEPGDTYEALYVAWEGSGGEAAWLDDNTWNSYTVWGFNPDDSTTWYKIASNPHYTIDPERITDAEVEDAFLGIFEDY